MKSKIVSKTLLDAAMDVLHSIETGEIAQKSLEYQKANSFFFQAIAKAILLIAMKNIGISDAIDQRQ